MSRVPRPAASNSSLRAQYRASPTSPTSPSKGKVTSLGTPARLRVPSLTPPAKPRPVSPSKHVEEKEEPQKERLSLKEQIALKRAEAKKAQTAQRTFADDISNSQDDEESQILGISRKVEEDIVDMGRWGVRETVERARSTGNLNLSSRSLPCIPSCLFEVHLGVTPKPLDSVIEPDYPADDTPKRSRQNKQQTSWFEAQDLMVLKARGNEIVAIQPELSLFGSLKVIDLHSNKLKTLPTSLTILASLTNLDVSNNHISEIPSSLFSLPALVTLNLAHNSLTKLPFSRFSESLDLSAAVDTGAFYQPEVTRAIEPLPCLRVLDAGHNKLTAAAIDASHLPSALTHLKLDHNPLGQSNDLLATFARLKDLQELVLDRAVIKDDSFTQPSSVEFPKLQLLDLTETEVTERAIRSFFANSPRSGSLNFHITTAPPIPGELRVSVGKKVIKEAWEIEAEQHFLKKKKSFISANANKEKPPIEKEKEPWEIEAEQGLTTAASRRRAKVAAAASLAPNQVIKPAILPQPKLGIEPPKIIEKEQWEIEAEQGLLTEGGRRRLRAQQAAALAKTSSDELRKQDSSINASSLANSAYYTAQTLSLTLPPSAPPNRSHARAFSMLAAPPKNRTADDLLVPVPTLPLVVIMRQDFAAKLQVLTLSSRRADPTFSFPSTSFAAASQLQGGILPRLSELYLDGCSLGDMVSITYEGDEGGAPEIQKRGLLEVISDTFPWLTVLDLSYNALTSDGLSPSILERLLVPSDGRKGLKILRLRGNRLTALEAFEQVADLFRGNRQVQNWCLEELDVRDNEIAKLPPLIGLIPMDVFLVDGNVFRVPARKVWEREGTKGLLSWLRGRIE